MSTNTIATEATNSFEARGQADGMLDAAGFFTQSDWEFELETLQDTSRAALESHLSKGPVDHETAVFLKGFLMNSRDINFTPFRD